MIPEMVTLNIGRPKNMPYKETEFVSGIWKNPVAEAYLALDKFQGDDVANPSYHGGPDRAVCIYCREHYPMWDKEFQTKLPEAAFGENLTVRNMLEKEVCIGDVYKIGETVVQVTQGRYPCNTISKRNQLDNLWSRVFETGYTGFFCRVLEAGWIRSDSAITLLDRHPKEVSVLFANRILFHETKNIEGISRILEVEELAEVWRKKLAALLEKAGH